MKKTIEKIWVLTVYDSDGIKPSVYVSKDRSKCVKKAFSLIKLGNDEDSEYGLSKKELSEIKKNLETIGGYTDEMVTYVIEETQLM